MKFGNNPYFFPLEKTTCRSKVINLDWLPSHGDRIYYTQLAALKSVSMTQIIERDIYKSLIGSDALLHPVLFQSSEFSPRGKGQVSPGSLEIGPKSHNQKAQKLPKTLS